MKHNAIKKSTGLIGKIRMRLAADSVLVTVKHRALNQSTELQKTLYTSSIFPALVRK
jgi:hypothetical protein